MNNQIGVPLTLLSITRAHEMAIVEMKVALAKALVNKRKNCGKTQVLAAVLANTSQSRYAKVEHADASVSLELRIKMYFALGANKRELLKVLSIV